MNYYIQDICCICLSISNEKCSNKFSEYPDNLTPLDKIKTVFSELTSVMESDDRICTKCNDTLGFIYEFHKTCLKNINIFSSYKKIFKENQGKKQCGLFVDLNEWQKFKENILNPKQIKVEPQESILSNDDIFLDAKFAAETHSSGPTEIKKEIEINYETRDGESETFQLNSEIKIEHEESELERERMNETNETPDVELLKSNIKDFEHISVQSTAEVVDETEENQELIEDSLWGVSEEKSDEGQGHFEFIDVNHSNSFERIPKHVATNIDSDSHIQHIDLKWKTPKEKVPYKCDICGKLFSRNFNLEKHMLIHTGEKPHKCEICGKLFTLKGDLKKHFLTHTGEKPHKCDICGKLFSQTGTLNTHRLIHTGEKPHKCDVCGKLFIQMSNLRKHELIHTGVKSHKCDICGKLFTRKGDLKKHILIHTGEKPHKCDVCGKLFTLNGDLKKHFLIHTGEKPHKCDICGKLFSQTGTLNIHKLIHTGEKPHQCDTCGKSFIEKGKLKRHMLTHL